MEEQEQGGVVNHSMSTPLLFLRAKPVQVENFTHAVVTVSVKSCRLLFIRLSVNGK